MVGASQDERGELQAIYEGEVDMGMGMTKELIKLNDQRRIGH